VLAAILAASTVVMALPLKPADAIGETIGGDAGGGSGGDAETGYFEYDGNGIDRIFAESGIITSGEATGGAGGDGEGGSGGNARGGDATSTYTVNIDTS
jgi:hypothetical protein